MLQTSNFTVSTYFFPALFISGIHKVPGLTFKGGPCRSCVKDHYFVHYAAQENRMAAAAIVTRNQKRSFRSINLVCEPRNRGWPFLNHKKMADFECFHVLSLFSSNKLA